MSLKTFRINTQNVRDWLEDNHIVLHEQVLYACENALTEDVEDPFPVVCIINKEAEMTFYLSNRPEDRIDNLQNAIKNFVEVEEYELAARARDCVEEWKKRLESSVGTQW